MMYQCLTDSGMPRRYHTLNETVSGLRTSSILVDIWGSRPDLQRVASGRLRFRWTVATDLGTLSSAAKVHI
jgi:hypothetical protein